ncbi:MAG: hypothetical protein EXR52_08310 [Dehalococcoidia bacterium]|nr:hypothetical protein [Dehalococcoidia bacterium]
MVKPICDALVGVVYDDDAQVMDSLARRRRHGVDVYRVPEAPADLVRLLSERADGVLVEVYKMSLDEVFSL